MAEPDRAPPATAAPPAAPTDDGEALTRELLPPGERADPAAIRERLVTLRGKGGADYLEVKWRLVWLRAADPDALVETTPYRIDDRAAMFSARVTLTTGGVGTGFGSEEPGHFGDYIEKAETKAIGRALAALGFGTQFVPDHDFNQGARTGPRPRVVDSPVDLSTARQQRRNDRADGRAAPPGPTTPAETANGPLPGGMTEAQNRKLHATARDKGLDHRRLAAIARAHYDVGDSLWNLSRSDASALIDDLNGADPGELQRIADQILRDEQAAAAQAPAPPATWGDAVRAAGTDAAAWRALLLRAPNRTMLDDLAAEAKARGVWPAAVAGAHADRADQLEPAPHPRPAQAPHAQGPQA